MKGKRFFFILCVCMTFISCSNVTEDKNDVRSNDSVLKFLDIQNAKNLYIGTSNSGTRSAGDAATTQKLFKITEDGYVEEVKYLDENKKEITISQQPNVIQNVNDEYVFVGFGWSQDYIERSYLVRKTDGAVFDMTKVGNPNEIYNDFKNSQRIKTDGKNNMYFLSYDTQSLRIVKVNLNGIDALNSSFISASTDYVDVFDVDWNGNVIYDGMHKELSHYFSRIRKVNGSFENIESNLSVMTSWMGFDGNFYFFSLDEGNEEYWHGIKKMTIDETYKTNYEICSYVNDWFSRSGCSKIILKDKMFFIGGASILEVFNEGKEMKKIELANLNIQSTLAVTSTENYYYILGVDTSSQKFLIRVNPNDHSYINLLSQNEYDVYAFTASETDGITFNALRMSDGKKIIGKVGIDGGDVTVIDEESDVEITYLERIN